MTNPNTGKVSMTVWVDPPPEGMAWKQDARFATGDEVLMVGLRARPIVPATVMVTLPGDLAERVRALKLTTFPSDDEMQLRGAIMMGLANARAALARKPDSRCGYMYSPSSDDWHSNCPDCRGSGCTRCVESLGHVGPHAEVKPCPVMVYENTNSHLCGDPNDCHLYRRPCKLAQGHGGEHE